MKGESLLCVYAEALRARTRLQGTGTFLNFLLCEKMADSCNVKIKIVLERRCTLLGDDVKVVHVK